MKEALARAIAQRDNCFVRVSDPVRAQALLERQLKTEWPKAEIRGYWCASVGCNSVGLPSGGLAKVIAPASWQSACYTAKEQALALQAFWVFLAFCNCPAPNPVFGPKRPSCDE